MYVLSVKEFNDFLRENALWLSLALAAVILLIVAFALLLILRRKKKGGKAPKRVIDASSYITALGGQENIVSHSLVRSRIVLQLVDYAKVDKEKLKEAGVDGFIMMSDKLTLVIKGDAEKVNKAIFPGE
ncbi:MAG: hypothetical protein E7182_02040 [Erysipelotrichaceae bacterium]|nr:hypothetical protein [Erysipelotrichaceae bacterium]